MFRFCLTVFLLLSLVNTGFGAESPSPVRLHSREALSPVAFTLDDADWRWLGEKRAVTVALYAPDNPPFDVITDNNTLEGISADYTLLALSYLGLRFQTRYYPSRRQALEALLNGESDMLVDDAGGQTLPEQGLLHSRQLVADHPVMVSRETAMSDLEPLPAGSRVALPAGYLTDRWVLQRFPGVAIARFASAQSALSSVAFGENDYFIGNLISASYLIERNYASTLSVVKVFNDEKTGPRFIFPAINNPLQRGVEAVLAAITPQQHNSIFGHWSQGQGLWQPVSRLQLTGKEQRWLAQHKELRVLINSLDAPFTLTDSHNKFNGMAADLLRLIHLRTGINFTMQESATLNGMLTRIQQQEADFIGAVAFSHDRETKLLFTRPYILPPYVMVSRDTQAAPKTLQDATSLAITPGHTLYEWLTRNYPHLTLVPVENTSMAMQMVSEGRVDGAVNNLIGARYMIDRYFRGRLSIATRLGEDPARIAFGVGRDNPELLGILNKALADIPPRDISQLAAKWQGTPDVKLDTWLTYRQEFYWLAGIFALLVLTSLFWNYHLHRAVRQRKEAQQSLQQQATFLESLFNGSPVPVCVIDIAGNMVNHNPAWRQFFSPALAEITRFAPRDARHPLHAIYRQHIVLSQQDSPRAAPQRTALHNGQESRDVIYQAEAFYDRQGQVAGLICSWQDITGHQRLLADLSLARERAEQANRTKSTFLATMSHEIRTPISAIIGLLELAVTTPESQRCDSESVRVAYESSLSLMGLIGDILDMAKIESGKLELTTEWVRFDALAEPVVRVFEGLARQKGLRLHYQGDLLPPDELLLDPMRLRQILSNLISNAIKFTGQGSVDVQLHCLPCNGQQTQLEITVTDTGMGISEEEQALIFNPYAQSEAGKKQTGTGLGLAICEQLVSMMGGTIQLRSKPNRGTCICVRIPVETREQAIAVSDSPMPAQHSRLPLTILIVDDHPANRLLLKRQLERLGHAVIEAEDGAQALRLWQHHHIQLVITDCNMPVMDGVELTRQLRHQQRGALSIMGLTANAQPEERARCLAAGMDECLFKPLRLPQLEILLNGISRPAVSASQTAKLHQLLDLTALNELVHHDQDTLLHLLRTTRDENRRDLQMASHGFERLDRQALGRSLHRMAGSAQIIGATSVATACRQLEQLCERQANRGDLTEKVAATFASITALNEAITEFVDSASQALRSS